MNNLTKYLVIAALHDMYLQFDMNHFTQADFNRFVAAAIASLPDEPHIVERLTDYMNNPYELSDDLEDFMIAIARDENLSPYFGG